MEPHLGLNRVLRGWQIFMITVSGVIGTGILHGDTSALEIAGPGGVLFALMVVALVATCTMECISEMVQLFPVPNALMSYVACFVDRDLAWLVGIAYWFVDSNQETDLELTVFTVGTLMPHSLGCSS